MFDAALMLLWDGWWEFLAVGAVASELVQAKGLKQTTLHVVAEVADSLEIPKFFEH